MQSSSIDRMQEPVVLKQFARRISEDLETPVSLFMGMRRKEGAVLLESTEVDGRWGRYSIMAFDPLLTVRCGNGRLALEIADSRLAPLALYEGQPFVEGLRGVMRALHIQADETAASMPPVARALYGYLGFGMAGVFMPRLAASLPPEQAECVLVLPRTVLVFDHLYNTMLQASYGSHPELTGIHGESVPVSTDLEKIESVPGAAGYKAAVQHIKLQLGQGEAIQVVPSVRFSVPCEGDSFTLYRRLRECNPSPYMFYMEFPDGELFGASPEVMLRCTEGKMRLSPIAGTRPRGTSPAEDARLADELLQDPKE
ncbi:MAG: chorismate-binding protein, partial [Deltaproteobacteria bacterium]|nr:chorismate-binding protein [Deltaproteobacteria bacterium]